MALFGFGKKKELLPLALVIRVALLRKQRKLLMIAVPKRKTVFAA